MKCPALLWKMSFVKLLFCTLANQCTILYIAKHSNKATMSHLNVNSGTLYRITGIFGGHFNLAVWRILFASPN